MWLLQRIPAKILLRVRQQIPPDPAAGKNVERAGDSGAGSMSFMDSVRPHPHPGGRILKNRKTAHPA